MTIPREYREYWKRAIKKGWTVTVSGGNHLQWKAPDGKTLIITGKSPGGSRALKNEIMRLKRAGLE